MKKLAFVVGIVLLTAFNSISQQIDIHVTKILFRIADEAGIFNAGTFKNVDSYYFINLQDSTVVYKCPNYNIDVTRNIISKLVINNIITIVIEDNGTAMALIIDKNKNSVRMSDQDPLVEYSYEFVKFSMKTI
jgi:hypothetical protein